MDGVHEMVRNGVASDVWGQVNSRIDWTERQRVARRVAIQADGVVHLIEVLIKEQVRAEWAG